MFYFVLFMLAVILWWLSRRYAAHSAIRASENFETGIPRRFVVVDLETTGLYADRHEIIEIGAIKVTLDEEVHPTFQALILPKKRISSRITALTGLDRAKLRKDGHSIEAILPQFLEFCEGLPFVAFNAKFDRSFIEAACLEHGHNLPSDWICALEISRRAWPGRSSYRLTSLARDGGCDMSDEHRAVSDCRRAMEVLMMAAVQLRSRGIRAVR